MRVQIRLMGCDDSTYVQTEVTPEEFDLLCKIAQLTKKESTYGCMPKMYVEEIG